MDSGVGRLPRSAFLALVGLSLLGLGPPLPEVRRPASPAPAAVGDELGEARPTRIHPGADLRVEEFFVHIPPGAVEPLTVLIVLHGMGGSGEEHSLGFQALTDRQGWVVMAPSFNYGDWREPVQVTREATSQSPRIGAFLHQLPALTGLTVRPRALVYGFSRGGQAANRLALAYPELVAGVAVASSGTYTLPFARTEGDMAAASLRFPYGVADVRELFGREFDFAAFQRIPFWIGVGARDNDVSAVPHQWDPYLGDDRLERAERFAALLSSAGVDARIEVFPQMGHEETSETRQAAVRFLASLETR